MELAERLVRPFDEFSARKYAMSPASLTCPTCGKMNAEGGRYCIRCGAILNPIYCSSCGTKNPDGLEQCLECGASMPTLAGLRWNPIVTVINPTSAMAEEKQSKLTQNAHDSSLKRLRAKLDRHKQIRKPETSANNHI
jgi:predicted RNA-binding Zn-ribbon protein involved in translation (DUF1610 family)